MLGLQEGYKYKLRVKRKMFYDEETRWGVYSFEFVDKSEAYKSGVDVHPIYRNFVISGTAPLLKEGEERLVIFKDSESDKYGKGYSFIEVTSDGLKTPESQAEFLRQMINNDKHYNKIIDMYPPNETYIKDLLDGKYDLKKISGIKEATEKRYLTSLTHHEGYEKAIVKLAPIGVGISTIKKLVDFFEHVDIMLDVIENKIYEITRVRGFGFKKVDELALKIGYKKDEPQRIVAGAAYVLEQMSESGDIKIPIEDFDAEMCKVLEISEVSDEIFHTIMSDNRFSYENGFICLESLRLEELYIATRIATLIKEATVLDGLEENKEKIIGENEARNGFEFNKQQLNLIDNVLNQGVTVLTGAAGTGKTAVVKTVVDIFESSGHSVVAMALSGKAAQVMAENGIENSGTIHRQLKFQGGLFAYNEEEPLPYKLIIVDEASMVNNSLFASILSAIANGCRLLVIGDDAQLPPIGHGAVFSTMLNSSMPKARLTEIHRQAAKSGIITAATDIRNGKQLNAYGANDFQVIGELKDMRIFNYVDKTLILEDIKATVEKFISNPLMNPKDLQILTAMKRGSLGVPTLNKEIQEIINPTTAKNKDKFHLVKNQELRVGDRVIQGGNLYDAEGYRSLDSYDLGEESYKTDVFNGTIGYIVKYEENGLLVRFDYYSGTEYVYYAKEDGADGRNPLGMLELAYAITTHRSQGSGFKTVLFAFDYSAYMLLSREFVYTGVTRAIDNCLMFVENTALHQAIKTTKGIDRKTFLNEYLENELSKIQ